MIPIILSARARKHYVEIEFRDIDNRFKSEFIYTEPIGGWTELNFDGDKCVYAAFLNTMVYKNVDVLRRIAQLYLDAILDVSGVCRIELLNALRILDPTFHPPWVNLSCNWQYRMMMSIIYSSHNVVASCRNIHRIEKYVTVLQKLVLTAQQRRQ